MQDKKINYYKVQKVQEFHNIGANCKGNKYIGVPADLIPCIASYDLGGERLKALLDVSTEYDYQIQAKDRVNQDKFYLINFYKVKDKDIL